VKLKLLLDEHIDDHEQAVETDRRERADPAAGGSGGKIRK